MPAATPAAGAPDKTATPSDFLIGGAHKMPFSRAVRAGDFVFVSGTTAVDRLGQSLGGNISEQTRLVLESIRDSLRGLGCEMSDVVKTTCWLEDPRDFWNFNRVFAEFFPENPPARSTLQSGLMLEGKVEIEAIAYKP
jgi:reactive intermediate/imine deaminase